MSANVNFTMLRADFELIHHQDRIEKLLQLGFPKDGVDNLLAWIMNPNRPEPSTAKQGVDKFSEAMRKCEAMINQARQDKLNGLVYENPLVRKYTPFQQDILHIRHLMGRSSIYDAATRNNPEFKSTSLVKDIDNFYGMGRAKPILLLCGATGCGKTFAAIAKAIQLAKVEFDYWGKLTSTNVVFLTAKDLTDMLIAKHFKDLKNVKECGFLILDDLGTEPIGFKGADFNAEFQGIMDYRHKFGKQTILTTNLDAKSDNPETKTFKSQYGERVLSRLNEVGVVIGSNLSDMRGQQ